MEPEDAPQVDAMSCSVVRVNGVELATDASKPSVINIHINQPSALYSLIDTLKSQWKGRTTSNNIQGEQKVLGAVLIMTGLVCVSFGVFICLLGITSLYWSGSCFWTGFPFIAAGAVAVVSERRPSCSWRTAAFLLHLVSLGVAIGGLVVVSNELSPYRWSNRWPWNPEELCNSRRNDYYYRRYYETTTPEPYDYRAERCKDTFNKLLSMFNGIKVVVLVSTCLALCISLYSLGFGIKRLCCMCAPKQDEEEPTLGQDSEPLLAAEPPPYKEKCSMVETI